MESNSSSKGLLSLLNNYLETPLVVLCMLFPIILVPLQVFIRYIFGQGLQWNVDTSYFEELSILGYVFCCYLSVPAVIKRRANIRLSVFVDKCIPQKYNNAVLIFNDLLFLLLTCTITVVFWKLVLHQVSFPQVSARLRLPFIVPYGVMVFAFALSSLRLIQDLVRCIRESGKNAFKFFLIALICCLVLASPLYFIQLEEHVTEVLIVTMALGLILGVPVGATLGLATLFSIIASGWMSPLVIGQKLYATLDSFPILAIFFFVLTGIFMGKGGLSNQLINLADKFVGRYTGGLALTAIVAAVFFGAISGSGVATVTAIGLILIPSMVEKGYSKSFACALVACAGGIGMLIPPSNPLVLYGILSGVSIGKLFMGGIVPGLLLALFLGITSYFICRKNGWLGHGIRYSAKEKFLAVWDAKWALGVPVIIMGGIYGGFVTPTEAAGLSSLYGLIVSLFILHSMSFKDLGKVCLDCIVLTGAILLIIGFAAPFGYVMTMEQLPEKFAEAMISFTTNKYLMLFIVNVFLLIVGALMDGAVATILLTPILVPLMQQVGVDPLLFGIILSANFTIGMVTPPIGMSLYVAAALVNEKTEKVIKASIVMIIAMFLMVLVISYVPELSLFLTRFV